MTTRGACDIKRVKVALLTDVHANLPALEAVIKDAREQGACHFWNAGDSLGYGAYPAECLELLQKTCQLNILGNYDHKVLLVASKMDRWRQTKHPLKAEAFVWAWENIAPGQRRWLAGLPRQVRVDVGGVRILLRHTLAISRAEVKDPVRGERRWRKLEQEVKTAGGADLVLGGHLHHPFEHGKKPRFCAAGAVGRPVDGDPRAHYLLIKLNGGKLSLKHRRVPYDHARAAGAIREKGQPEAFAVMVTRGVDLERAEVILAGGHPVT